jgi:hypothetical protein
MRKVILFTFISAISIYLAGCCGIGLSKSMVIYTYDFTKYSRAGFLFTPEKYSGNYESVGIIEINMYPQIKKEVFNKYEDSYNLHEEEAIPYTVIRISTNQVIDSLYSACKNMGADGLTDLKIENTEQVSNETITYCGIKASGLAIKRK